MYVRATYTERGLENTTPSLFSPRYCFEYQPLFEGLFNDIANWLDKEKCNICEDAGKVFGLALTGLEDASGEGEAESAVLATLDAAVKVFTQNARTVVCSELGGQVFDPIANFISGIDANVKTQTLESCLTQICAASWQAIESSAGQFLLSQVLSYIAALMCGCSVPFTACEELI